MGQFLLKCPVFGRFYKTKYMFRLNIAVFKLIIVIKGWQGNIPFTIGIHMISWAEATWEGSETACFDHLPKQSQVMTKAQVHTAAVVVVVWMILST